MVRLFPNWRKNCQLHSCVVSNTAVDDVKMRKKYLCPKTTFENDKRSKRINTGICPPVSVSTRTAADINSNKSRFYSVGIKVVGVRDKTRSEVGEKAVLKEPGMIILIPGYKPNV